MARRTVTLMCWLLLLPVLSATSLPSYALTEVEKNFSQLVNESDMIVVGTMVDTRAQWGEGAQSALIFSTYTFTNLEVLKGNYSEAYFELHMAGGQVGEAMQIYPGSPLLRLGKTYTLFIKANGNALFPFVGVKQGVYDVQWDAKTKDYVAVPQGIVDQAYTGRHLDGGLKEPGMVRLSVLKSKIAEQLNKTIEQ